MPINEYKIHIDVRGPRVQTTGDMRPMGERGQLECRACAWDRASPRRDPPEHLFVTGTFSLLDLLLNVPLEVALAMTPLPTAAVEALIGERGPWRPYLEVALALESDLPDRLEAACTPLRVDVDTAVSLAAQARSWAAQTAAQWRQEAPAA